MTLVMTGGMPRAYNPYEALAGKLALAVDWRRSDLVTASGSPPKASSILDVISAANFAQASGSSQPGYDPPGGFEFDGVDDYATLAAMPLPSGDEPWYYIGLFDQAAPASNNAFRCLAGWGGASQNTAVNIYRYVTGGVNRCAVEIGQGTSRTGPVNATVDFSGVHFIETWFDGTSGYLAVDGGAAASVAVSQNLAATRVRLGAYSGNTPASFWLGSHYLDFWLNALPAAAERAALVAYFNAEKAKLI